MKTSDLSFDLPEHLIAQEPPAERGTSRLLVVNRHGNTLLDRSVTDLPELLPPEAVVVFNNSRVRKSRLLGTNSRTGGKQEMLLLNRFDDGTWEVMGRPAKQLKEGARFHFPGDFDAIVENTDGDYRRVRFSRPLTDAFLDRYGHIPLPPYIRRPDNEMDAQRYQTVYSSVRGSVAAPTAGLHFTPEMITALSERGITVEYVTLHVGIGTFLPVRTEALDEHEMHREAYSIETETAARISAAASRRRPIVAVGTTVVRTLESAWNRREQKITPGEGSSTLFITPGYDFGIVNRMFTNFHTPRSTLLAMVSAFAGYETIMTAYRHAVASEYRFFSYGDAMLIV